MFSLTPTFGSGYSPQDAAAIGISTLIFQGGVLVMKMWEATNEIVKTLSRKHPAYGLLGLAMIMLTILGLAAIGGKGIAHFFG